MFCEKCGREIPEDSEYCAYCGVKLSPAQKEPDWEEAARLREAAEERLRSGGEARSSGRDYDPGCVTPGAPRKQCARCGRDLPSSTIGEYCALCTMRRSQEEDKRIQRAEEADYEREKAQNKRDRYDISDQFDWRAYGTQTPKAPPSGNSSGWSKGKRPTKKADANGKRYRRSVWMIVAVILVLTVFLPKAKLFMEGFITGIIEENTSGSKSAESALPDETEAFMYLTDWEDPEWVTANWGPPSEDMAAFETWVRPMADWVLDNVLPQLSEPYTNLYLEEGTIAWYTDGIKNRIKGQTLCIDEDGTKVLLPFDMVVVLVGDEPDGSGYVLCLQINSETLFDSLDAVDADGLITQNGEDFFDGAAGTYPFDDPPPKDLSGGAD